MSTFIFEMSFWHKFEFKFKTIIFSFSCINHTSSKNFNSVSYAWDISIFNFHKSHTSLRTGLLCVVYLCFEFNQQYIYTIVILFYCVF